MKCQACDKAATKHITELVDGSPVEYHVCEEHEATLESLVGKDVTESRCPIMQLWDDRAIIKTLVDRDARSKMAAYLLPVLCRALNDESAEVRIQAAFALMELGSNAESAIPALREALDHGDDRLRKVVEVAIVLIDSGHGYAGTAKQLGTRLA